MREKNQYSPKGYIAFGRYIFKNDIEKGIEEFYEVEIYGPTINMQLLHEMSAMIKPGDLPIAIQLSFTDIGKQFKQNYKRPLNEYSKYFPEENYIKLLENNTPKGFTSKFLKSSSAFLYKKQETQEEILKRYNIKEREKQVIFYICQELTSADIASKLNIDVRQVEALRKIIMHKLGALNVVGVAFFAVATGIAELPEA